MNILIINQHPKDVIGGSEIQCDLIATWLTRIGHRVNYLAVKAKSDRYDNEYTVIPQAGRFSFCIYKAIRENKPELVYWRYNKKHFLISAFLCKLFGIKLVFSISTYSDIQAWIWSGVFPFERFLVHFKSSKGIKSMIGSSKFLFDPIKSFTNYLGFYFTDGVIGIQKKLTNKLPVKQQISIYNSMDTFSLGEFYWGKPFIVWVANIKSKKNPEAFIKLAQRLIEENVDFIMIGNIQQPHYNEILKQENLPSNFHYLGPKQPAVVNSILKSSLFLVHTCNPEGFGNNFIQAWFQSKPTITLFFDPDDIIKKHKLGFHSNNFDNLVKDTKKLIHDKNMREETGLRAKIFAINNFSPEQNSIKFEQFFFEILKNYK